MAASVKIDQLTGDNYDTWKIHMRAILKKNDLWDYVSGAIPKPAKTDAKFAEWCKMDGKAESDILLAVSPSELIALNGLDTSKSIWDKLKSMYQSSGPAREASLLKKLVLTRMQEEDDLRKHIADFFDAVKKLKEIGLVVIDELLAILLLYSLPESFTMFRTAMESRDDLPSTEILKVKIIEDYESRKSKESDQGALFVKRNKVHTYKKGETYVTKNKNKSECYRCGRYGHYAKECRSKFIKKTKQSAQQLERKTSEQKHTGSISTMLSTTEEVMSGEHKSHVWCIDSGCTGHMCNEKQKLKGFTYVDSELNLANNESTRIAGKGKVSINVDTGSEERRVDIDKVFYVSDLRTNLLSVAKITDHGFEVRFRKSDAIVIDEENKIHMRADRIGNLYHVRLCQSSVSNVEAVKKSIDLWHERLGHLNECDLKIMTKKNLVHGLNIKDNEKLSECEICMSEKQTCKPFPKGINNRTSELLEIVHTDVCGPMRHQSFAGKRYFVTFIDDKSRWCEVYFIRNKSDVFNIFKNYKAEVENFTGKKIKCLQSDNGCEYVNNEFNNFLKTNGITRRLSVPHTPQQNGVAERKNRTLIEMARCMMRQVGCPPSFWAEAVNTANYIRNRCPTRAINGEIPFTIWKGNKPTVIYMQVFGSKVYYKEKGKQRGKFDSVSEVGIFMGYDTQSKAYRIHNPRNKKIILSRNVKFLNKTAFRHEYEDILNKKQGVEQDKIISDLNEPVENIEQMTKPLENSNNEDDERSRTITRSPRERKATVSWERLIKPSKGDQRRSRLVRVITKPTTPFDEGDHIYEDTESEEIQFAGIATIEPMTWNEAEKTDDVNEWRKALKNEFLAQIKNDTWEIVPRPHDRKVIGSRFVFSTKNYNKQRQMKVRLVAKGCSQRPGEDFHETYSPVVKSSSIRILAAISAELGLDIHHMDVVTAYLNGRLEEEVYMNLPEQLSAVLDKILSNKRIGSSESVILDTKITETAKRWRKMMNECDDCVCLLKKSLYGLRQSGLQWHKELVRMLLSIGFKALPQDQCVFVARKNEHIMLIAIYVDDLILATNDNVWLNNVKNKLSNKFEMKDMGKISDCLGIQFSRDNEDRVYMEQSVYIERLLERFGMCECKPALTPIDVNVKLMKPESVNESVMKQYPCQSLVGALMFLAVSTRPDITYSVNYLSQFNTNYNVEHWKAAKCVLRYLKGTPNYGLVYERTGLSLFSVVDADWAANSVDRKSYSGFAFIFAGAPISWEARKQRVVALSSTEAEYVAISEATREALYLSNIFNNIGMMGM
ncbi:unnamed protein product [Parnassius mnemosyne]|uniref:Retrovirus-related Pol polyprotein from transposon TNT 1-94 n=1 Tax=Parnassius mnemosyne TaxID=213953 RepID=A0AAV1LPT0_9NEOP